MSTRPPPSRDPPEAEDFEEVDPDSVELLDDDGPEIEAISDEPTSVGMNLELIEALREPDRQRGRNPLTAIGEAAADLPEGIDAMFDRILAPTERPPKPPPTDPSPAPAAEDPDEAEFRTFMDAITTKRKLPNP